MKTSELSNDSTQASRRRFTKAVAAAFVAAPLVAAAASNTGGQKTPPATREATAPPKPQATPTPAATPQTPSPLALAYMEVARLRFGEKLTNEELKRVQNELKGNVRTAERLRAVKLKNSDEPDFTFIA
jgi:hypothetical protein